MASVSSEVPPPNKVLEGQPPEVQATPAIPAPATPPRPTVSRINDDQDGFDDNWYYVDGEWYNYYGEKWGEKNNLERGAFKG